ncbi:MAG: murein transglycosylase A [Candidatus Kinetoplastibacterium crithidii]|nr:MAG: murein transglycosylase A [Candidatus Kinetoplastibacterium crithidii]
MIYNKNYRILVIVIFFIIFVSNVFAKEELILSGDGYNGSSVSFKSVSWDQVPSWFDDDFMTVWDVFLKNCRFIIKNKDCKGIHRVVSSEVWSPVCNAAFDYENSSKNKDNKSIREFFQKYLDPWAFTSNNKLVNCKMTGYCEPFFKGSRHRTDKYQWPIFAVPDDLVTIDLGLFNLDLKGMIIRGKLSGSRVIPYDSRESLGNRSEELPIIAWLDNAFDSVFLGTQGSGRIFLQDGPDKGKLIKVGYASSNGYPFVSIGKWLLENEGINPSYKNIKKWMLENPTKTKDLINKNPRVVFFHEVNELDIAVGPIGSYGIELTPMRSIAVDSNFIPLGTPIFFSTNNLLNSNELLYGTVFAQDTGSLIKGADRSDFFWGSGFDATEKANTTDYSYRMWILWPKNKWSSFFN